MDAPKTNKQTPSLPVFIFHLFCTKTYIIHRTFQQVPEQEKKLKLVKSFLPKQMEKHFPEEVLH